jgi:Flp pilus assembly pilin Flp
MVTRLRCLLRRDEGQDIIEYALLGAFISIVAIVAIQAIGPLVNDIYVSIQNALTP